jgi:hypothetical protein
MDENGHFLAVTDTRSHGKFRLSCFSGGLGFVFYFDFMLQWGLGSINNKRRGLPRAIT